jgi:hypothetical protein
MTSDRDDTEIPHDSDDRLEWICARAKTMDTLQSNAWIEDEIRYLWNNPDEFAAGNSYEQPAGVEKEVYILFRLGIAFGTDYEHHYPRDTHE